MLLVRGPHFEKHGCGQEGAPAAKRASSLGQHPVQCSQSVEGPAPQMAVGGQQPRELLWSHSLNVAEEGFKPRFGWVQIRVHSVSTVLVPGALQGEWLVGMMLPKASLSGAGPAAVPFPPKPQPESLWAFLPVPQRWLIFSVISCVFKWGLQSTLVMVVWQVIHFVFVVLELKEHFC